MKAKYDARTNCLFYQKTARYIDTKTALFEGCHVCFILEIHHRVNHFPRKKRPIDPGQFRMLYDESLY